MPDSTSIGASPDSSGRIRTTTVLVGNPNVGKSVLFKNLTNRYVTVSNFPGTTVEIFRASASFNGRNIEVIDTPGINDLTPSSEDARVTRALLDEHDDATLIQVADAKNLRRALLLTLQLADLGRPLVLVLNMTDELEQRGGAIDTDRLSAILGVPVVSTVAIRNQGTDELINALAGARPLRIDTPPTTDAHNIFGGNDERVARANAI
ncbi:MAG: 50S ribosome-binding GTPase, partial [Gemmatimonadota bacterium]|nr:50S ribosome-binding GTPase [Gemmatimonadota bacterium]